MPDLSGYPPVIRRYWYSIDWDVAALWALDLPVRSMPTEALLWHLDVPVWPDPEGNPYRVTPREVMADPVRHEAEHWRIMEADTAYPIEVIDRDGKPMILDGIHRLTRLWSEGAATVRVRPVPPEAVRWLKG